MSFPDDRYRIAGTHAGHAKRVLVAGATGRFGAMTGLLLALGIRRLSVARSSYRQVVASLRRFSLRSMEGMGEEVLKQGSAAAVRKYVAERLVEPDA